MSDFNALVIVAGLLFIGMALGGSLLKSLPLSTALFYLVVGVIIGPIGLELVDLDIHSNAVLIERITEIAVIISLFAAGLKLRVDWRNPIWHVPVRLASIAMILTVGLSAVIGSVLLDLGIGAAILLSAILAPTDPVLASDVQVSSPQDLDNVRFGLTGEAGLNDGTAFPFVMLGLGLMHLHDLGDYGVRWLAVDVLWAVAAGLGIGALLGTAVGYLVLIMRRRFRRALGLHEFLTLGLVALSYGVAIAFHSYGFLAVFAAGLALGRMERRATTRHSNSSRLRALAESETPARVQTNPSTATSYMVNEISRFIEQIERIGEVVIVVLVGVLLSHQGVPWQAVVFVPILLLILRPVSVAIGLIGEGVVPTQRRLITWFGIRGIGSLYYLAYASAHGINESDADMMAGIVLATIATSILVHGVSVTPVMKWYEARGAEKTAT